MDEEEEDDENDQHDEQGEGAVQRFSPRPSCRVLKTRQACSYSVQCPGLSPLPSLQKPSPGRFVW